MSTKTYRGTAIRVKNCHSLQEKFPSYRSNMPSFVVMLDSDTYGFWEILVICAERGTILKMLGYQGSFNSLSDVPGQFITRIA
jgi:hypothetical protein